MYIFKLDRKKGQRLLFIIHTNLIKIVILYTVKQLFTFLDVNEIFKREKQVFTELKNYNIRM